ncbi:unnamed protein product [Ranitomeya imitator]|uniref:UBC core domain-containing protein n=1 Tax=Ranitomeya imitator TaxID=111125 RepID=A0ABN9KWN5_9NEOB|nr:unnamed protein product [Ranitomeya imitator]
MQRQSRLKRELHLLSTEPPAGISCWQVEDSTAELRAQPGDRGTGALSLRAAPGAVSHPIYHPNIDTAGRICLDILKPPPTGAWRPALNLSSVLASVQLLMSEPNPEDPLMADIAQEYKYHRAAYTATARSWTERHARPRETEGPAHKRRSAEPPEPAKKPRPGPP